MRTVLPILTLLVMFFLTTAAVPQAFAQLRQGDTLVIDRDAGTDSRGALFKVNPSTGARTLLSDFGDSSQEDLGVSPSGVTIGTSGNILVIDADAGTDDRGLLFSINPSNGNRTVLSDFSNSSQGDLGLEPVGVTIGTSGNILVIDADAGADDRGLLFSINPSNGNRTVLSDFSSSSQGDLGLKLVGVTIGASGNILVIDQSAGTDDRGLLFSINPSNGNRTVLSDFSNSSQGDLGLDPFGAAIGASGNILVIDANTGTDFRGALFSVNPSNGNRTLISDFSNSSQGDLGSSPVGVTIGASGNILVIDADAGTDSGGLLFSINPSNGNRAVLSDFNNSSQYSVN